MLAADVEKGGSVGPTALDQIGTKVTDKVLLALVELELGPPPDADGQEIYRRRLRALPSLSPQTRPWFG